MPYSKRRKNLGGGHKKLSNRKSYSQNKTCRSIQNAGDPFPGPATRTIRDTKLYYSVLHFGIMRYYNIQDAYKPMAELKELNLFKEALKAFIIERKRVDTTEHWNSWFNGTESEGWSFGDKRKLVDDKRKLVDDYTSRDAIQAVKTLEKWWKDKYLYKTKFDITSFIPNYLGRTEYENKINEIKTWCETVGCRASSPHVEWFYIA